jgi:ferredoxin
MRCAAACPTQALSGAGFEPASFDAVSLRARCLRIECERMPGAAQGDEAVLRTPCLGALRVSDYLRLRLRAGEREIELVDRGLCVACPASGDGALPGAATRERLRGLLSAWDLARLAPTVRRETPARGGRTLQAGRRGFLKRVAGIGRRRPKHASIGDAARSRSELLELVAARWTRPVPAAAFPAIAIGESCEDHRVCAAICPTHALRGYADEGIAGLSFDARLCIGCGACVASCPAEAVSLAPTGGESSRRLTAHRLRRCEGCEAQFADRAGGVTCPSCRKEAALFADVARLRGNQI